MAIAMQLRTLNKKKKERCVEFQVWLWNELAMKCSQKSSIWVERVFGIYISIYYGWILSAA